MTIKIKNVNSKVFNNIKFKSLLEISFYKTLCSEGIIPNYEASKFIIWEGIIPTNYFYTAKKERNKNNNNVDSSICKDIILEKRKLVNITYTPDFTFKYKDYLIIIEAKGFPTDSYTIKKKMFRKYLEQQSYKSIYFELYNKRQLLQAIQIIKNL